MAYEAISLSTHTNIDMFNLFEDEAEQEVNDHHAKATNLWTNFKERLSISVNTTSFFDLYSLLHKFDGTIISRGPFHQRGNSGASKSFGSKKNLHIHMDLTVPSSKLAGT